VHIDNLLDERDRLLGQRADILKAMAPLVMSSDLDQDARDEFRISVEQTLDDAFFSLIDPLDTDIADHEAASAWQQQKADVVDFRGRL
jgi:hypothetical protein